MVKQFVGSDLLPEALKPTAGDRARCLKDDLAFLLSEPTPRFLLAQMGIAATRRALELGDHLVALYSAIRHVRDQRGDDRCWKDWEAVYMLLPEGYIPPQRDSTVELELCKQYIASCHDPKVQYVSPQRRIEELEAEEAKLQKIVAGLAERVVKQSELLSKKAEKGRPQDPGFDGAGWTYQNLEHGGDGQDVMPQCIIATDAQGRSCPYIPLDAKLKEILKREGWRFDS